MLHPQILGRGLHITRVSATTFLPAGTTETLCEQARQAGHVLDLDHCMVRPFRRSTYQLSSRGGVIFSRGFFQEHSVATIRKCITTAETNARASDIVLTECIWRNSGVGVTTEPIESPWAEWGGSAEQKAATTDLGPKSEYLLTGNL